MTWLLCSGHVMRSNWASDAAALYSAKWAGSEVIYAQRGVVTLHM